MKRFSIIFILLTFYTGLLTADEVRIAVASNFVSTLKPLAIQFEQETGHKIILAAGSTGKHYAQISHGAPFDLFFAADHVRPRLLEQQGHAIKGTRFTYAFGQLVLWSPWQALSDTNTGFNPDSATQGLNWIFEHISFRFIAIANPALAPYGKAAQEVLEKHNFWDRFAEITVRGENISQAYHFVKSGNAQIGFVAYSQILADESVKPNSYWEVPASEYQPIEQQAIMLQDKPATRAFITFLNSPLAKRIIQQHGYLTADQMGP